MSMFPVEGPETEFSALNKLIYGLPKTGKTTLASLFIDSKGRKPAFIATEKGHGALTVSVIRVTSWLGFTKLVLDLKQNAKQLQDEHSCFVIDLISDLDELCAQYICEKNHVASLGDLDHGKGWFMHKQSFRSQVNALLGILPCVFICHTESREDPKSKAIRQEPAMGKQCAAFINGKVDIIMWIQPSPDPKSLPNVIIRPTLSLNAGSRYPHLIREYPYDPKCPAATVAHIQKVFVERLDATATSKE